MLIVTGMSGAGRSTVGNALEDLGWYVVDNLPPQMLKPLVDLAGHTGEAIPKVAAMVDVRGGKLFADVLDALEILRRKTPRARAVPGCDGRRPGPPLRAGAAAASAAGQRHAARRHHRGAGAHGGAPRAERLRHRHVGTQHPPARDQGRRSSSPTRARSATQVTIMSFGFKYGLPPDADLVADCRFLPNPFWIPELQRPHRTRRPGARLRARARRAPRSSSSSYVAALEPVLAGYRRENKRHATIALGCTGGKHRSVAIAEELGAS